jgi:hypothetical protein
MAFPLSEIGGFRLGGVENLVHLLSHRAVPDQSVERFNGELNQHDHAHKQPPGAVESRSRRARHGPQFNIWFGALHRFSSIKPPPDSRTGFDAVVLTFPFLRASNPQPWPIMEQSARQAAVSASPEAGKAGNNTLFCCVLSQN